LAQLDIEPNPKLDSTVRLVVPPNLSSLEREVFAPFIAERTPALEKIAGPNRSEIRLTHHDDRRISYDLAVWAGQTASQISDFIIASGLTTRAGDVDW
jgi:hypothetical protein